MILRALAITLVAANLLVFAMNFEAGVYPWLDGRRGAPVAPESESSLPTLELLAESERARAATGDRDPRGDGRGTTGTSTDAAPPGSDADRRASAASAADTARRDDTDTTRRTGGGPDATADTALSAAVSDAGGSIDNAADGVVPNRTKGGDDTAATRAEERPGPTTDDATPPNSGARVAGTDAGAKAAASGDAGSGGAPGRRPAEVAGAPSGSVRPPSFDAGECLDFGPIETDANAAQLQTLLADVATLERFKTTEITRQRFWIYLEPREPDIVQATLAELKDKGVSDLFRVREGELKNAISLGVYSTRASLDRRLAEITGKGFQPVVVPRTETATRHYVRATVEDAEGFAARLGTDTFSSLDLAIPLPGCPEPESEPSER